MDGIQLIKDGAGKIKEIRIDAISQPELAEDIYHLISAIKRAANTEQSHQFKRISKTVSGNNPSPMSLHSFNELIRKAKASGEVSEADFSNMYSQWRKKEKLSLQN